MNRDSGHNVVRGFGRGEDQSVMVNSAESFPESPKTGGEKEGMLGKVGGIGDKGLLTNDGVITSGCNIGNLDLLSSVCDVKALSQWVI